MKIFSSTLSYLNYAPINHPNISFKTNIKKEILLLLLTLLFWCVPAYPDKTIYLAATEWPPYTGNYLTNNGIAAEIVNSAFARVDYQSKFMVYPWARAQQMVRDGLLDGMGIAWYTDQRAISMAYSKPYLKTQIVLIKHRDDTNLYSAPNDLDNKHFGILRGYGYLNLVNSESIRKTVLGTLEQSFQMLSTKRIDLTLEEKLNAHHHLAMLPLRTRENIVIDNTPLQIKDLHITISRANKDHKKIITDFNRGLDLIIEDGTYMKILNSYHPRPLGIISLD